MTPFIPSPQQQQYFDWIQNASGSALLEAVAGSGKTTTLIQGLRLMKGDIFFGAYNKKIAEEIASKAPNLSNLNVATMHSAGFSIWRRSAPRVKVDQNKCTGLFNSMVPNDSTDHELLSPVIQLVSLAKQAAFGAVRVASEHDWLNLVDHFSVDCREQEDKVVALAKRILAASINDDVNTIDFDDMILAPLIHKCKSVKQYDWVLIDEAQDTNASRRALALLMLKRGGRLVAVGDPHQAIYGFTGADSDALELIAQAVSAVRIPLTVSYRCPQTVTALARTWVNHIESHPAAPQGSVTKLASHDLLYTQAHPGDAILCRFNAPIIGLAYGFIAEGVPAKIEGRDIGNNLKVLARRWRVKTPSVLIDKLAEYQDRETTKLRVRQKESLAVAVEDKVRCLQVLIERCVRLDPQVKDIVSAVCAEIDNLFGDNVGKEFVLFSTIHKSKGREWARVFWLQSEPPKWVRKDWEHQTEKNLSYVACTRAMSELYLVPTPPKGEAKMREAA
jgi:DNA helicase-2/ATP-dependent DNA helicase PcrA